MNSFNFHQIERRALPLVRANDLGKKFAAWGWSEIAVGQWLEERGYKANGITASRIRAAYVDQQARG